ncbi:hypothetical protein BANRA_05247 [Klebsiella pneumoniae]|nr:hypothetical protein BANRA_05247 [Klebsiella pneumoniae]
MTNNFPVLFYSLNQKNSTGFLVTINNLEYYFVKGDLGKRISS